MLSHWTLKDPTPWCSTTPPMFADGHTQCRLMGSGAKSLFLSTGTSVATNVGLNIMFELAMKFGRYYTEHRRHSNTTIAQRQEDSVMCPLNYYVCKPVKEESTEFVTTRRVTALSTASFGTPLQKRPATKNLKLTHHITHYRRALTHDKCVVMALANELS